MPTLSEQNKSPSLFSRFWAWDEKGNAWLDEKMPRLGRLNRNCSKFGREHYRDIALILCVVIIVAGVGVIVFQHWVVNALDRIPHN
jgi:hypothetical protein